MNYFPVYWQAGCYQGIFIRKMNKNLDKLPHESFVSPVHYRCVTIDVVKLHGCFLSRANRPGLGFVAWISGQGFLRVVFLARSSRQAFTRVVFLAWISGQGFLRADFLALSPGQGFLQNILYPAIFIFEIPFDCSGDSIF